MRPTSCNNRSNRALVAILVVSQTLTSSITTSWAFGPTLTKSPLRNQRSNNLAAVATRTTSAFDTKKPYFADFPTSPKAESAVPNDNATPATTASDGRVGTGKSAVIAGATGYIGRACVRECVARGYDTVALVRDASKAASDEALSGASLVECDVTDAAAVASTLKRVADGCYAVRMDEKGGSVGASSPVDLLISCLAAASGAEDEVYAIDYGASLNLLNAGMEEGVEARHYVLLSAFCCRNPILKLQQAKLKFEEKLAEQSDMTYSIVRPTAFFKSVSGQYESIMEGNSYVLFADGNATECNPIAETELAEYMCDSALEEYEEERWGKILNIGGPDGPLSNKMLAEMMFKAVGKPAKFVYVPTEIFDWSIGMIEYIARTWPSQKWEDVLETSKIGKYYAVEDMLTTEEHEKFGTIGMMDHFEKIAREGQDPFTPVRATAVIAKTLEALPAVSISIPIGLGLLSRPDLIQNVMASSSSSFADVPMVVAALNDNLMF